MISVIVSLTEVVIILVNYTYLETSSIAYSDVIEIECQCVSDLTAVCFELI